MSIRLRDGSTTNDARLDRLIEFDERSREHAVNRTLSSEQQRGPRTYTWTCDLYFDQQREGMCTSASISEDLSARPVRVPLDRLTFEFVRNNYWETQKRDPFEGGDYPGASPKSSGTSVLSAIKYYTELGYYEGYKWGFSEEDLLLGLVWTGPAILGIAWKDSMYEPSPQGEIAPTGPTVGGHAILCRGFSMQTGMYRLRNTWSSSWGINGDCFISRENMKSLLAEDGEVCFPQGRKIPTL